MLRQRLNIIFYNARRRVVGLFKSSYDAATLCCRRIVLSEDRKAKRKEYVGPYADRCQFHIGGRSECQRQRDSSTEIMGPERKSKEDVAVSDLTIIFCRQISQGRCRRLRYCDLMVVVTSRGLIWRLPMLRCITNKA